MRRGASFPGHDGARAMARADLGRSLASLAQARIVAGVAEAVYPRITGLLAWRPQGRVHLVLLDSADFANGYASPLPFNNFAVFLSPPDEGELLQNREWLELVLTHEFTHIVHLDKAYGPPDSLRRVFGRLGLLFPNALEPFWICLLYTSPSPRDS